MKEEETIYCNWEFRAVSIDSAECDLCSRYGDDVDFYETECRKFWESDKNNCSSDFKYCPFCGKLIRKIR